MLRLRPSFILARLLSTPSAAPVSHLHRLLSTAAATVSPIHEFNAEEYLVGTCGLTRAQALRASTKVSHIKSPANSDAAVAFLAGLGLSSTDVAAVVAKDPKILYFAVEKTLSPVVTGLAGLGLTPDEITLLVSLAPRIFRYKSVVAKMRYYLLIFGSFGSFFRGSKHGFNFLSSDLDKVVKPNVAFLQECGVHACDLPSKCFWTSTYTLIRRLHHTLLKTMQQLAEGKCQPDSDLHEPRTGIII
jgi:mTERF domain-containing protein